MFGRLLTLSTLAALIAIGLIFQSTSPVEAGPVGILAVFFLFYVVVVGVLTWLIHTLGRIRVWFGETVKIWGIKQGMISIKKSYYYASVLAFAPVMLLGLQSVGGAGIYEIALVMLFIGMGVFYVKKRAT